MHSRVAWLYALAIVLSGCTSAPQQANPAAPASTSATAALAKTALWGELTYAWWGASAFRNEVTQKVIDLFQQKNPNVKINPSIADFNTHFQKLTVSAAAGDLPCLPQMQSTGLAAFADPKILRPLDHQAESKAIDTANVAKGVVHAGRGVCGKVVQVPTGVGSFCDLCK